MIVRRTFLTVLGAVLATIVVAPSAAVRAQLALPSAVPAPSVSGLIVAGMYLTAPITLDGNVLFRIGAPLNPSSTQLPIGARVTEIQTVLSEIVAEDPEGKDGATVFDPHTLRVDAKRLGDVIVLEAVDAHHSDPLPIVTVTSNDARANTTSLEALGAQWQESLQSALERALLLRQPAVEQRSFRRVGILGTILVLASLAAWGVLRLLWKRMAKIEADLDEGARSTQAALPDNPEDAASDQRRHRFLLLALNNLEPAHALRLSTAVTEAIVWAMILAWLFALTWGLSQFAQTTTLAQAITHGTLAVAATIVATGLLNRLLDIAITRAAAAWRLRRFRSSEDRTRLLLRIPTIAQAVAGAKAVVLVFVAALTIFGQIGVPIGSVVTIGGLAAIALSLAAQNFVRDFLNGFLVLLEDQYVVGDYVTINTFSGSVEQLTLRMVQLRNAGGELITIPHSSVVSVVNQSRNWSRVDYKVPVDPAADIGSAIGIVQAQIEHLAAQGDWTHGIDAPIEWIGIDSLSKDGIVVRASVKTAPLRQFEFRRQINERVRAAFAQAGIAYGAPLTTLQ